MKKLFPSHDDFIRSILSHREIAIEYVKSALPAGIVSKLDFSGFEQLSETYLSKDLRKTISDIVYQCKLKGSSENIKVSLLIEHKSHPDKFAPVQIGSYIFSAFQKQLQNKEPLSVVIPILLYHGEKRWKYRTLTDLFEGIDDKLKQFLPSFDFIFNDLGSLSNDAIEALNNKFLAASFLALKHSWNKKWLETNAVKLFNFALEGPKGLQKGLIIYIGSRSVLTKNVLNSLPDTIKKDVMNSLEIYYERGIEKGRQEGIEEGRIEEKESLVLNLLNSNRFTIVEIANLAGVNESFVKRVNASKKKKL